MSSLALASMMALAFAPLSGLAADVAVEQPPVQVHAGFGDHVPGGDLAIDLSVSLPPLPGPLPLPGGRPAPTRDDAPGTVSAQAQEAASDDVLPALTTEDAAAGASLLAALLAVAWGVLRLFGWAPLLPFFSRIEDGDLARHPARRAALDHINANPGATVRDIQRALGLAWGSTVHHLRRLERAGLVAVRRDGGRRGHWPLGQAPPRDGLSGADRAMAGLVKASPGLPQRDLARLTGVGAPAACKRLARLEEAGLVAQVQDGRARLYVPTARLLQLEVPAPAAPVHASRVPDVLAVHA